MQTDIIGVSVGIIGILIGVLVSYYFYRKSIRIKEPCYAIKSNNLIQGHKTTLSDLEIFYKNKPVENLTISKVLLWNQGAETIDRQDISTANALRISGVDNVKILDTKVLVTNNTSSQVSVNLTDDGSCAHFVFDYLDQHQGAVIQFIHTGKSSAALQIVGDIKGAKLVSRKLLTPTWVSMLNNNYFNRVMRRNRKIPYVLSIIAGLGYIFLAITSLYVPSIGKLLSSNPPSIFNRIWIMQGILVLGGITMLIMGIDLWRRHSFVPRGLEAFNED